MSKKKKKKNVKKSVICSCHFEIEENVGSLIIKKRLKRATICSY